MTMYAFFVHFVVGKGLALYILVVVEGTLYARGPPAHLGPLQTTGTGSDLARHQCAGLCCAPATTWRLVTTPDSLI